MSYIVEDNNVRYQTYIKPKNNYLTMLALEDGFQAKLSGNTVEYKIDKGEWTSLASNTYTPTVNAGQRIYFKGNLTPRSGIGIGTFSTNKSYNLEGNCMSMLYGDEAEGKTDLTGKDYVFNKLFSGSTYLVEVESEFLPATTLASFCYYNMFKGCTSLVTAPELPATTLAADCYQSMFSGCTSLVTAPELHATTLANFCYESMFYGCTSLVTAPELPATTLDLYCYSYMFYGCTSLVTAPELPATTLAPYCYSYMFNGCTSLVTAPELPATTLESSCYYAMFSYCTSLVTAPELPATTLADYCYSNMFQGCTSLVTAPELPATTLAASAYTYMFSGCKSLVTAPELPATTLASTCYSYMFNGCTSLVTAPELPSTTLATSAYTSMFYNCSSLVNSPELPATTLAIGCYASMFYGCTSLETAPELPATTLANYCYQYMFYGCTSLVTAPELPATTLEPYSYQCMFNGCNELNNITMLATNISASNCLSNWVKNVASSGTFIKVASMTSLPSGVNGIPSGWTVQDNVTYTECTNLTITANDVSANDINTTITYTATVNGIDYKGNNINGIILTGTSISEDFGENTSETETVERVITFEFMGVTATTTITQGVFIPYEKRYLTFEAIEDATFKLTRTASQYSLDNGATWTSLSSGTISPKVLAGNTIMLKATSPSISSSYGIGTFSSTGKFKAYGNIMSMYYGDNFANQTDLTGKNYIFYYLFSGCTNIIEAKDLVLPATTLAERCYPYMFYGCRSLVTAPELPATTLTSQCYSGMFNDCIKLNNITMLATDISASNCLFNWVKNVASSGTFTKAASMTSLPSGTSGIPSGWEVQDYVA